MAGSKKCRRVERYFDAVSKFVNQEEMTEFIKGGLAIDENHLGLRVLAESSLGLGVKKTAEKEIGEPTSIAAALEVEKREACQSAQSAAG